MMTDICPQEEPVVVDRLRASGAAEWLVETVALLLAHRALFPENPREAMPDYYYPH